MTATCPYPLANPFNTQRFTNFNVVNATEGKYFKSGNAYSIPQSQLTYNDVLAAQNELHVPNQDIPLGDQLAGASKVEQDTIRCPDGTVLKISNGQILHKPATSEGCWPGSDRVITFGQSKDNTWEDDQISDFDSISNLEADVGISKNDLRYWEHANEMSEKLCANMSIQQKMLLAELSGYGFFNSKLVDDA